VIVVNAKTEISMEYENLLKQHVAEMVKNSGVLDGRKPWSPKDNY
jgi:hypothetical protein